MIKKFKSFEDAERDLWNLSPDFLYYKRIAGFYRLASKLSGYSFPHGIYKYKNLNEANENRINQKAVFSIQ
ncbi:MAG: hypothetical protein WC557_00685 [Ignavibacteriaceae bacterium]